MWLQFANKTNTQKVYLVYHKKSSQKLKWEFLRKVYQLSMVFPQLEVEKSTNQLSNFKDFMTLNIFKILGFQLPFCDERPYGASRE